MIKLIAIFIISSCVKITSLNYKASEEKKRKIFMAILEGNSLENLLKKEDVNMKNIKIL